MNFVDLIIVAGIVAMAVWGFSRGLTVGTFALIGFAGGAVLGSRLAPLVLDEGLRSPYAPILALPGAIIIGAILASGFERLGFRFQARLERLGLLDGLGGGLLAGLFGLIAAWIAGAVISQVDAFEDPIEGSAILEEVNAVVPPPGPVVGTSPREGPSDPLPTIAGPPPRVRPVNQLILQDPEVRAAARSVVRILAAGCGHGGTGSGWVAGEGTVVTNAHVVAGAEVIRVQVQGKGPAHAAQAMWYDRANDVAVLRSHGVSGVRALPLERTPEAGTAAAIIGFPGGEYSLRPGRLGQTSRVPGLRLEGGEPVKRNPVTSLLARVRPGNSGGPMVDGAGRVVTTVFAGRSSGSSGYGVSNTTVGDALRRARQPVRPGSCDDRE